MTLVVPSVQPFSASNTVRHSVYKYPFDNDHMAPKSPSLSLIEKLKDSQRWNEMFIKTCRSLLNHVENHKNELSGFDLMMCDSPPDCGAIISEFLGLPRIDIKPAALGMRLYHDISLVSYIPEIFSSGSDRMSFVERVENFFYHTLLTVSKLLFTAPYDGLRREFGLPEERTFQDSINMVEMVIIFGHFALEYPQPILPGKSLPTKIPSPVYI